MASGPYTGALTVLKATHHGSSTSSTPLFLSRFPPRIAVIQCGADNPYGHPTPETLDRLQRSGARIFRNDEHGDVIVNIKEEKVYVAVTKPGAAFYTDSSKQLILARSRESPSEIELKLTLADKSPEAKPGRRADKRGPCKGPKRADKAPPWSPNLAWALACAVELSCDRDYFQPDSPASGSRRSIPVPTAPYSRRLAPAGASRAHTASPSNRVAPDTRRGLEESRDELVP